MTPGAMATLVGRQSPSQALSLAELRRQQWEAGEADVPGSAGWQGRGGTSTEEL